MAGRPLMIDGIATLLRLSATAHRPMIASVILATLATGLEIVPYYCVYQAVSGLLEPGLTAQPAPARLVVLGVLAAVAVLGRHLLWARGMHLSHRAAFAVFQQLQLRIATRLNRVPLGYLTSRRSGEIQSLLRDEGGKIELFLAHAVPELISAVVGWVAITALLIVVDWRMALVTAVVVPVAFGLLTVALRDGTRHLEEVSLARRRVNGALIECLTGMPTLKLDDPAGYALRAADESIQDFGRLETGWARRFLPLGTAFAVLVVANITLIVPVGYWWTARGELAPTDFLLFLILGLGYSAPLLRCYELGMQMAFMTAAGNVVAEVLTAPQLPDSGRDVDLPEPGLEFDCVQFGYQGVPALREVSFTARAGQVTALVGPSGAGKSTAARLVARFFDVDGGAIRVGGVDLREIGVAQLNRTVSVVFQEPFLLRDTLRANLLLGDPAATDSRLVAAIEAAALTELVHRLPAGLDTPVGERGVGLSVGERQRVTIARMILKDAPVVVLDEATAYADPASAAAVQQALAALVTGRTVLVIAHRLRTIRHADHIVVLDGGRAVEQGTHDELMATGGRYRQLWESME
ncbi:MAG: ABC transporter ATP-binding protein, partial [Pseudonocardiaceae bacterium]